MILAEVKRYLKTRKQATLADIALHCDAEPDAVRGMLEQWIRKGKVTRQLAGKSCGTTCNQCTQATVEIYVWLDDGGSHLLQGIQPVVGRPCDS